jgi:hypothetical protein
MSLEKLRREAEYVTLYVGDIIIDLMTGNVGILLRLERKIDVIEDDVYFWEISWASTPTAPYHVPSSKYMEEASLKLSIVAGLYDRYSNRDSIILLE